MTSPNIPRAAFLTTPSAPCTSHITPSVLLVGSICSLPGMHFLPFLPVEILFSITAKLQYYLLHLPSFPDTSMPHCSPHESFSTGGFYDPYITCQFAHVSSTPTLDYHPLEGGGLCFSGNQKSLSTALGAHLVWSFYVDTRMAFLAVRATP